MAVATIVEILGIKTEADLIQAIQEFESSLTVNLKPLCDRLKQQVLTSEVQQLELHMTYVESWRDRVSKYLMLSNALQSHGESHRFLLPTGKNVTATDREAYMTGLTNGASACCKYLEQLIRSIDSRVNVCKILLRSEVESGKNSRYV